MELVIPFMLFLLETPLDDPSRAELTRHPFLFASEEECQKAAQEFESTVPAIKPAEPVTLKYFCKPVPQSPEFERLFAEMDENRARAKAISD